MTNLTRRSLGRKGLEPDSPTAVQKEERQAIHYRCSCSAKHHLDSSKQIAVEVGEDIPARDLYRQCLSSSS